MNVELKPMINGEQVEKVNEYNRLEVLFYSTLDKKKLFLVKDDMLKSVVGVIDFEHKTLTNENGYVLFKAK